MYLRIHLPEGLLTTILQSIENIVMVSSLLSVSDKLIYRSRGQNNTLYGARFKSWTGGNGLARKYARYLTFILSSLTVSSWVSV